MKPGLSRLTAAVTFIAMACASLPALAADPAKLEQAKRHMQAGAAFYNDPTGHKCEEAVREFHKAYDLSGSLNALRAEGICLLELERDGEAIEAYEKYIAERGKDIDPAEAKQMKADLLALKSVVATVTITTDQPGVRIVDTRTPSRGFPIINRYTLDANETKLGIHPGEHVFTAQFEDAPDQQWRVSVPSAGALTHQFSFAPKQPTETAEVPPTEPGIVEAPPVGDTTTTTRPVPVSVYVAGGATVALAVPTAIFMVLASGAKSDYDAANGHKSKAELEDMRSDVTTKNLLGDVFLGATAVGLVTTGVLFFTRPTKPAKVETGRVWFTPQIGATTAGAAVQGAF